MHMLVLTGLQFFCDFITKPQEFTGFSIIDKMPIFANVAILLRIDE